MPLSSYVLLHFSRINLYQSKLSVFPLLFHLRLAADIAAAQPLYHCDVSDIASLSQVLKADIEDFLHMVISEGIVDGLGFTAEFDQIGKP